MLHTSLLEKKNNYVHFYSTAIRIMCKYTLTAHIVNITNNLQTTQFQTFTLSHKVKMQRATTKKILDMLHFN